MDQQTARPQIEQPRFMGHEHVAVMNALLEGQLQEQCAALSRDHHVLYEITGDPEGIATWLVTAGPPGLRFSLDETVDEPVLLVRTSYQAMAAAARPAQAGVEKEPLDPEHVMYDAESFALVSAIVEASRPIATVDVSFE